MFGVSSSRQKKLLQEFKRRKDLKRFFSQRAVSKDRLPTSQPKTKAQSNNVRAYIFFWRGWGVGLGLALGLARIGVGARTCVCEHI